MKFLIFRMFHPNTGGRQPTRVHGKPDRLLIVIVAALSLIGILMVYNSSVAIAIRDFSDQYYFVREQLKWLGVGLVGLIAAAIIPYRQWYRMSLPLLLLTLLFLIAVFLPGVGVAALGARRWVNLGIFVLQPAELSKFSLVIYLSAWFSNNEKGRLPAFVLLMGMVTLLVIMEPDMGTAFIIMCVAVLMYFYSGASLWQFSLIVPILIVGVVLLSVAAPYRFARLTTFLNTEHDPLGASYQIRQIRLALGSGGIFGVGIGQSRQKYEYLPEANTDSIFAIIGEEFGFIGATAVVTMFLLLVWRGFRIARHASDRFGKFLGLGFSSWIAVQTGINLAAMVAIVPLTGVPLPFISYGGSSLIMLLVAVGILLNISRH